MDDAANPGGRKRKASSDQEPAAPSGTRTSTACNALFLRTPTCILGARKALGRIETRDLVPMEIRACLPVAKQFQLFAQLLASLGGPLNARMESQLPLASGIPLIFVSSWKEQINRSLVKIDARWQGTAYQGCTMILNANLVNNRGIYPELRCFLEQTKEDMQFKYTFQELSYENDRTWKVLEEGSTNDDVWKIIESAMEDLSTPGDYPRVGVFCNLLKPSGGTLSMEANVLRVQEVF
jgi:hypothetical protein